jgi:putative endonuclease
MKYVYLIQSVNHPRQRYVGISSNYLQRIQEHNAGQSTHTAKFKPWKLIVAIKFEDDQKALHFEKYLKSGSGRSFSKRHFWSS